MNERVGISKLCKFLFTEAAAWRKITNLSQQNKSRVNSPRELTGRCVEMREYIIAHLFMFN